jgi:hypothetical protein
MSGRSLEAPQSDDAPQGFDDSEGGAADCEAVGARKSATDREERDERSVALLESVCERRHGYGTGSE